MQRFRQEARTRWFAPPQTPRGDTARQKGGSFSPATLHTSVVAMPWLTAARRGLVLAQRLRRRNPDASQPESLVGERGCGVVQKGADSLRHVSARAHCLWWLGRRNSLSKTFTVIAEIARRDH